MSIQFRNVVLPAVLMSSAVFSALTLPLVLFEPEPLSAPASDIAPIDEPSPIFRSFQPILDIFESGNKGLAIRYIGVSIVASVGAGIVTAELMRQTARRFDFLNSRLLSLPLDDDADTTLPEWTASLALDTVEQEAPIPVHLPAQELVAVGASSGRVNSEFETSTAVFNASTMMSLIETLPVDSKPTSVPILDDETAYKTCRINVPHVEKRLFSVLFQDNYYRLVRARKNLDSALAIAARLQQEGDEVIITQDHEAYTVWTLEPHARPVYQNV
jgi:hypothetical protein